MSKEKVQPKLPTLPVAEVIIGESIAGGAVNPEVVPDDDEKRREFAQILVRQVVDVSSSGRRTPLIETVLAIAVNEGLIPDSPLAKPNGDKPKPTVEAVSPPIEDDVIVTPPPPRRVATVKVIKETGFTGADTVVEYLTNVLHVHPPEVVTDEDVTPMPRDITAVSDGELRKLMSEQQALANHIGWLMAQEEANLAYAKTGHQHERFLAMKAVPKRDDEGKPRLAMVVESEVDDAPKVREWAERVSLRSSAFKMLRMLYESHTGNVTRLSREWTIRSESRAMGGPIGSHAMPQNSSL